MTIHMTARFEVKSEALELCKQTIQEFIDYIGANEPDTLLYTSLQEKDNPTRFIHYFIFRDEKARETHSNSDGVDRFTRVLYPNLIAPVDFIEFNNFASTSKDRLA